MKFVILFLNGKSVYINDVNTFTFNMGKLTFYMRQTYPVAGHMSHHCVVTFNNVECFRHLEG